MLTGETTSTRIYNTIKQALPSEVKQYGLWNNQLTKLKEGNINPVRFPAVFVSFENNYDSLSSGVQQIQGIFVLNICLESLKQSDEYNLRFKDYIYQQLSYQLPKLGFQDFYRSFETQDTDFDNLIVWSQEYTYSYIDSLAQDRIIAIHPYVITPDVHY
ncbi:hypothetical protein WBG78_28520 [Chryseolinea sp. T2]|uniref:hypothetical protein n=1 Tax=Chryseolinea sp. T2 TaxID=3129255 RepID=UPI003076B9FB